MRWIGTMLHLLYAPRHDDHTAELARLLNDQHAAVASIGETRRRLEARASRETAIDDIAGERGL